MSFLKILSLPMVAAGIALITANGGLAGDPPAEDAKQLVQNALRAELNGLANDRSRLLSKAIKADPNYAPARWHSGQVFIDGKKTEQKWLSIEEFEEKAASDKQLAEYARMRRSKLDDAAGNELLAKWCMRRGMKERAKVHWARVLRFQPNHQTAARRLDLKEYQGRWLTRDQIVEIKKQNIRFAQLKRQWQPKLFAWRKSFLSKDDSARDSAGREMKEVASAELVGLLETQLSPVDQDLALAVVDAIGGVKEQVATESLVRHAALSRWSAVRTAATQELKSRPLHGYVPIFIDAMMSPYEFQSWSVRSPLDSDQVLTLNYSVGQKGKHVDHLLGGTVNFLGGPDDGRADEIREELEERIEKLNKETEQFNEPIRQVLRSTTGQDFGNDPSQWNDWWNDFNEYHVPDFRPVVTSFQRPSSIVVATRPFSCFPAGTLVSTQTGRKPIEKIRVGDYVLSQNAVTGELAYKPVLETTVRQSDAIMEVTMNGEALLVTRGHPMWVNGRQWQMAKQLQRGDLLHGVDGPVAVESIRPAGQDTKVYNLVVAGFQTYFVGNSRVLVHDNSIYTPPGVSVPGE